MTVVVLKPQEDAIAPGWVPIYAASGQSILTGRADIRQKMHHARDAGREQRYKRWSSATQIPRHETAPLRRPCARRRIVKLKNLLIERVRGRRGAEAPINVLNRSGLKLGTCDQDLRDRRNQHSQAFLVKKEKKLILFDRTSK